MLLSTYREERRSSGDLDASSRSMRRETIPADPPTGRPVKTKAHFQCCKSLTWPVCKAGDSYLNQSPWRIWWCRPRVWRRPRSWSQSPWPPWSPPSRDWPSRCWRPVGSHQKAWSSCSPCRISESASWLCQGSWQPSWCEPLPACGSEETLSGI